MEITGKLIEKFDTITVGSNFEKREFVLEYAENPTYPEFIKFEVIKDKCSGLDSYKIGDIVSVHFNLKGRSWVNNQGVKQYFNTLQVWKYSKVSDAPAIANYEAEKHNMQPSQGTNEPNDLPF